MASYVVRKYLRKWNLLRPAQAVKRRLVGNPLPNPFNPADPRLCVSTLKCLQWVIDRGLAEGTDYYEFGIFRGFNLWYTQALARALGVRDMRFFGFDSFFGIPPVSGVDEGGPFREGDFSAYKDDVAASLTKFGADWTKTFLVEGFFEDSLNPQTVAAHGLRPCAFCVVDCDLYSSTVTVLDFVRPLLADTAVLFFDDWEDFGGGEDKGEPKAFREFLERNRGEFDVQPFEDLVALGGKGKAFVMRRTAPRGGRA